MNKLVTIILMLFSFNLLATEPRPGLWEVKMKIFQDGKEIDPMAEIMKQLDSLPEEQKKMVLEQITKNSSVSNGSTQTCYTKEMLKQPSQIATGEDQDCQFEEKTKTPKKVVATFKCNDGSSGTSTWEIKDSKSMKVLMDFKDHNGKPGKMDYSAKFIQDKCN